MPLPKEWGSKPKIIVCPLRRNNGFVCHNCLTAWPRDMINHCTGLCPRCREENDVSVPSNPRILQGQQPSDGRVRCRKCSTALHHTNFGICRAVCDSCKVEDQPLKQMCAGCDKYFKDCWNHLCRRCRFRTELCEEVGHFFVHRDHHRRACWCTAAAEERLEGGTTETSTSNI